MPQRSILDTRNDLLGLLPKNSVGVEIGVFKGFFSDCMLEIVCPEKLYLIDPWIGQIHSGDKDGNNYEFILDGDDYFHNVLIPKYENDNRVIMIKNTSGILRTFHNQFFDWAYVDGNHSYFGVTHDLEILRTKVKKNGYILGHDYKVPNFFSVVKAVNDFCKKHNLKIEYLTADIHPSYLIRNS
jgi:hypothetical protein